MKILIDSIIQKVSDESRKKEEAIQADIQAFEERATTRFLQGLTVAGLDWIRDYGNVSASFNSHTKDVDVEFTMNELHCEALQITPIKIKASFRRNKASSYYRGDNHNELFDDVVYDMDRPVSFGFFCRRAVRYKSDYDSADSIETILPMARQRFNAGWIKDSLEAKEAKIRYDGAGTFNYNFCKDEAIVIETHASLCNAFPDRSGQFDQELQGWRDQRAAAIKAIETREAEIAEIERMEQEYFRDYFQYHHASVAIHEENRKVVDAVQALYNKPVTLFELTYGVVATTTPDDEEEWEPQQKYLETRKVVVRTSGDKSGSFLGMDNNPIKYWHPVSTRMIEATALEPNGAAREYHGLPSPFDGDGFDLGVYYLVGAASDDEIETVLRDKGWQDYPNKPDEPNINYVQARRIRNAVIQGKVEFKNDDIDDIHY